MAFVADLVTDLHSNIDSIHKCIKSLSNTSHEAEIERLEHQGEVKIEALRKKHEAEAAKLDAERRAEEDALVEKRRKDEEVLVEKRRQEEEEIARKRKFEDEERKSQIEAEERVRFERKKMEDQKRASEMEERTRAVQEQIEREIERLEDEMERRVEEGKKMLLVLDDQRKAINAKIDAALNMPTAIPTMRFKSRAKTGGFNGTRKRDVLGDNHTPAVGVATPKANGRHAEAETTGSEIKEQKQKATTELNRQKSILNDVQVPQEAASMSNTTAIPHPETHRELPIELMKKTRLLHPANSNERDIPEFVAPPTRRNRGNSEAAKAWWETHQLESMTMVHPGDKDFRLQHTPTPDTQMNELSQGKQEALHSWVVESEEISISKIMEDPEDSRVKERDASHNSELLKMAMEKEAASHQNETARDYGSETLVHCTEQDELDSGFEKAGNDMIVGAQNFGHGLLHFNEEDRPGPSFNDLETLQIPPTYHFFENVRPSPSFIYRFTEDQRPGPHFKTNSDVAEIYRFLEARRPSPYFSEYRHLDMAKNGEVYRFVEPNRPLPVFGENTKIPQIYRFIEKLRPGPSFTYSFYEKDRPRPSFVLCETDHEIYRFFESQRPSPCFIQPHRIHHGMEITEYGVSDTGSRVFHFAEENRPQPLFSEKADTPRVYHFFEDNRPSSSFTYPFSESSRPLPRFDKSAEAPIIINFFESQRPLVSFDLNRNLTPAKSFNQARPGVYRFFETRRPQPFFDENLTSLSLFRFFERNRPSPSFTYRFSEADRPLPVFIDNVEESKNYQFLENDRPRPSFVVENSGLPPVQKVFKKQPGIGGIFRFTEHQRPRSIFTEHINTPKAYRFSEKDRPSPSFIYQFFEGHRPRPSFSDSDIQESVHQFFEFNRPKPSFDYDLNNKLVQDVFTPEVYHFSEGNRPPPSFAKEKNHTSVYCFFEVNRPSPSLIFRFSEIDRPSPCFSQDSLPNSIYHFLEENRPSPKSHNKTATTKPVYVGQFQERGVPEDCPTPAIDRATHDPTNVHDRVKDNPATTFQRTYTPGPFFSDSRTYEHESEARGVAYNATSGFPAIQNDEEYGHAAPDQPQRKSGVFASLVDAFQSEGPFVSRIRSQTYNSVPEDDYDPYSDETYEHGIEHESPQSQTTEHVEPMNSGWQFREHKIDSDEEFPLRLSTKDLQIRTHTIDHTVDIVPSFETYAHSDDDESPATPSDAGSSPFLENPVVQSWSPPQEEMPHREDLSELKLQASPLRADFEQTYPNYVTPRTSVANPQIIKSPKNQASISSREEERHNTLNSETQPSQQVFELDKSPLQNILDSTIPPSSTSGPPIPPPSRIPRRPTISDRSFIGRTPVNSTSTPINQNSILQKTRSFFEVSPQPPSQPGTTTASARPQSGFFNINRTTPSISNKNRPVSLIQPKLSLPADEIIIPKSLDGDNKPPSPAFTLPQKRSSQGNGFGNLPVVKGGNPFLDGLSRLVGSGGLENSMHNPARFEKERLITDGEDGY